LLNSQTALASAREEGARARGQAQALIPQLEKSSRALVESRAYAADLQERLQGTLLELGRVREQAAAERARLEILSQQFELLTAGAENKPARRVRKPAAKSS
jgi:hypothetical protein